MTAVQAQVTKNKNWIRELVSKRKKLIEELNSCDEQIRSCQHEIDALKGVSDGK